MLVVGFHFTALQCPMANSENFYQEDALEVTMSPRHSKFFARTGIALK